MTLWDAYGNFIIKKYVSPFSVYIYVKHDTHCHTDLYEHIANCMRIVGLLNLSGNRGCII